MARQQQAQVVSPQLTAAVNRSCSRCWHVGSGAVQQTVVQVAAAGAVLGPLTLDWNMAGIWKRQIVHQLVHMLQSWALRPPMMQGEVALLFLSFPRLSVCGRACSGWQGANDPRLQLASARKTGQHHSSWSGRMALIGPSC